MKRKRPIFYLSMILVFIISACVKQPETAEIEIPSESIQSVKAERDIQKGVAYTSWWHGEYSSPNSDQTIEEVIKPMGANWVAVVVTCYQKNADSTKIQCLTESQTPTDEDLTHVIQFAHDQGLKVMLKPHVNILRNHNTWRGNIGFGEDEDAWQTWFDSYSDFILHYARLAREEQVDYFVVGTELGGTSQRSDQWQEIIAAVREVYEGPITYAANWDEVFQIDWWDELDAIGVDAYFPLTEQTDPSVDELKKAWEPIVFHLGQFSQLWERPIIITEIGYRSIAGTNQRAYAATKNPQISLQEQANCYQAFFEAFKDQEWWAGVFWWNWTTNPNQGGPENNDFTPHNKPAENVLRENFGAPTRELTDP